MARKRKGSEIGDVFGLQEWRSSFQPAFQGDYTAERFPSHYQSQARSSLGNHVNQYGFSDLSRGIQ